MAGRPIFYCSHRDVECGYCHARLRKGSAGEGSAAILSGRRGGRGSQGCLPLRVPVQKRLTVRQPTFAWGGEPSKKLQEDALIIAAR